MNKSNREGAMKKVCFVAILLFCLSCFAHLAFADVWLDAVISFDQPEGSSTTNNIPSYALGPDDGYYVSIDIPETLILAFTDNSAYNGIGYDIRIREVGADRSYVDVYGSKDGLDWFYFGQVGGGFYDNNDYFIDLHGSGMNYLNYLKFVGLDNAGTSAGFDLDAVEALNSGPNVPIPSAAWLFGSGMIGLAGLRKKFRKS
jgi:hypothetical protein